MAVPGIFNLSLLALFGALQQAPPPAANPAPVSLISEQEPGDRLEFGGRVLDMDGRPLSKVAVVAYNADASGLYNPPNGPTRVPRIRGTAVTDEKGRFRFLTVRPGSYPNEAAPAHVHMIVAAPAHHVRDMEFWFEGDPFITEAQRQQGASPSGWVIVPLTKSNDRWRFEYDVRLAGN